MSAIKPRWSQQTIYGGNGVCLLSYGYGSKPLNLSVLDTKNIFADE